MCGLRLEDGLHHLAARVGVEVAGLRCHDLDVRALDGVHEALRSQVGDADAGDALDLDDDRLVEVGEPVAQKYRPAARPMP